MSGWSEPSRYRHLLVGIELDAVAAVRLEIAEKAVLGAAERKIRHRRGDADVDADHRRGRMLRELARRLPLDVKIDVALALGCDCASAIASSSVFTGQIDATGPKISSYPIAMRGDTSSNTVGPTK